MRHLDDMERHVSGARYHGLRAPEASDGTQGQGPP